jgi:serine/threonine protein kinase
LFDGKLIATFFSLKTLEKAIKGFANEQKLKVGGFGIVYKGTLDSKFGGLIIGMKKTNHMDRNGSQQFLNEVYVVSQINHCNIFQLHGCCFEVKVPILVYKYVPNGNLSAHLQNKKSFVGIWIGWNLQIDLA